MKYVYNRNRYKLITEASNDSDNVNPEFGETLIGGSLHRLLGFFRSKKNANTMSKYSKQLDRLLASMLMRKIAEEYDTDRNSEKNTKDNKDSQNEFIEGIKKQSAAILILDAAKLSLDGNTEEASKKVSNIPDDIISEMPEQTRIMTQQLKEMGVEDEDEEDEVEDDQDNKPDSEELDSVNDGSENQDNKPDSEELDSVNDESENQDKDGEEEERIRIGTADVESEKENDTNSDSNNKETRKKKEKIKEKFISDIKNIESKYNTLIKVYRQCGDSIDENGRRKLEKLLSRLNTYIGQLKDKVKKEEFGDISTGLHEMESFIRRINDALQNCGRTNEGMYDDHLLDILGRDIYLFLEKSNNASKNLTQKEFNRIRKEIEKASKDWGVTKEKLEEIDKAAREKKIDVTKITSRQGKELMAILNKAKNALLHTKPYDEIRKNQKRWYDKLDKGGRAINRKGYQTWVKKVTEIVSYYKGQVPDKVITVITDSLDKENISNDYVRLTQEFLGINKRGRKVSDNSYERSQEENYVTGYSVGDTIEYKKTDGKINTGQVVKIGKTDIEVKTKTGTYIILKKRVQSVKKK